MIPELTLREKQVARLIRDGARVRTLARTLAVSSRSVQQHIQALYRKLGVCTTAELAAVLLLPLDSPLRQLRP